MKTKEKFISDVMKNSNHHAKKVRVTFSGLMTAMISRPDLNIKRWRTNVCWFETPNGLYVGSYDHDLKSIQFKRNSQKGDVFHSMNDEVSIDKVWQFIEQL